MLQAWFVHICVREVSRQQLCCNKMADQHALLHELENVLTRDSVDDGLPARSRD
jgi:hypothetical protein